MKALRHKKIVLVVVMGAGLSGCLQEEQRPVVESVLGEGISFSAFDVNAFPLNKVVCEPFNDDTQVDESTTPANGIRAQLFYKTPSMPRYYSAQDYVDRTQASNRELFFKDLFVPTRMFNTGFASQTTEVLKDASGQVLVEYFGLKMKTVIRLNENDPVGTYEFSILSDDGAVMKIKNSDETWSTYINNDGDHPTKMGCASTLVNMTRQTRLEVEMVYYQGPRYHISNVLLWRPASQAGQDSECGNSGNDRFFNPNNNSAPTSNYQGLLNRGWKPLQANNYWIPMADIDYQTHYNPCTNGVDPVISNFRVAEIGMTDVWLAWSTDIPATSQVSIKNLTTGQTTLTTTDNVLRLNQQVHLGSLSPGTTYEVRAVSLSDTLGKAISDPMIFTTP